MGSARARRMRRAWRRRETPAPAPVSGTGASAATIDSLWSRAEWAVRHGKWGDAEKLLDRVNLEFAPGDPRVARAHYYLGEALFAQKRQLEAAREFRRASDETPNDPDCSRGPPPPGRRLRRPLAPAGAGPNLRTDRPLHLSGAAQSVSRQQRGQAGTVADRRAQRALCLPRTTRPAMYLLPPEGLRLRHPVSQGSGRYLSQGNGRSRGSGQAGAGVQDALGYREDVQETCGYIRRFHPRGARSRRGLSVRTRRSVSAG